VKVIIRDTYLLVRTCPGEGSRLTVMADRGGDPPMKKRNLYVIIRENVSGEKNASCCWTQGKKILAKVEDYQKN